MVWMVLRGRCSSRQKQICYLCSLSWHGRYQRRPYLAKPGRSERIAAAKTKADAEAKVADWKCPYCDSMNKHDALKCHSCGAPKDKGTAAKAGGAPAGGGK